MNTNNLTVFLDSIGRTIIGSLVKEDDVTLSIENPALVHIQPSPQTGQLQLQLLPLFFKEFQSNKNEPTVWNYKKNLITTSNAIAFHSQFYMQYSQLFAPQPTPETSNPEVVKLFEE
jgi:hypothetical protein